MAWTRCSDCVYFTPYPILANGKQWGRCENDAVAGKLDPTRSVREDWACNKGKYIKTKGVTLLR